MNELRAALELATEEELQDLTEILFRRRLNPLDYLTTPIPLPSKLRIAKHGWMILRSGFAFWRQMV